MPLAANLSMMILVNCLRECSRVSRNNAANLPPTILKTNSIRRRTSDDLLTTLACRKNSWCKQGPRRTTNVIGVKQELTGDASFLVLPHDAIDFPPPLHQRRKDSCWNDYKQQIMAIPERYWK